MTDYDDFKRFSGASAAFPPPKNTPGEHVGRMLTVGLRSDGSVSITSDSGQPGATTAQVFVMDRPTARWVAQELLRAAELPSDTKGSP